MLRKGLAVVLPAALVFGLLFILNVRLPLLGRVKWDWFGQLLPLLAVLVAVGCAVQFALSRFKAWGWAIAALVLSITGAIGLALTFNLLGGWQ